MTDRFDPLETSALISSGYRRYLRSPMPVRDRRIAAALDHAITHSPLLVKGPAQGHPAILARRDPPGSHPRGGAEPGVPETGQQRLAAQPGPSTRTRSRPSARSPPPRNVVVATGTGSGKTELPRPDSRCALRRVRARRRASPRCQGAAAVSDECLANDQMKRLRQILKAAPHITFGRYVGAPGKATGRRPRRSAGSTRASHAAQRASQQACHASRRRRTCCSPTRDAPVPAAPPRRHGPVRGGACRMLAVPGP